VATRTKTSPIDHKVLPLVVVAAATCRCHFHKTSATPRQRDEPAFVIDQDRMREIALRCEIYVRTTVKSAEMRGKVAVRRCDASDVVLSRPDLSAFVRAEVSLVSSTT